MCLTCEETSKAVLRTGGKIQISDVVKVFAESLGRQKYSIKCEMYRPVHGERFRYKTKAYGVMVVGLNNSGDLMEVTSDEEYDSTVISEGAILQLGGNCNPETKFRQIKLKKKDAILVKSKTVRQSYIDQNYTLTHLCFNLEVKNAVSEFAIFEILPFKKPTK